MASSSGKEEETGLRRVDKVLESMEEGAMAWRF